MSLILRRPYVPAFLACVLALGAQAGELQRQRFELTVAVTIEALPAEAGVVDLWAPVAQDTDGQTVRSVTVRHPEGGELNVEPRYGNRIWHKRFEAPFEKDLRNGVLEAELVFEVLREEISIPQAKSLAVTPRSEAALAVFLEENRLIPVKADPINTIVQELDIALAPPIPAARKIYDWLIDAFTYNYRAPGAGQGDVRWACDSRTGDCNDYHSMFLALCRNVGIPADHEFGFPVRSPAPEGRIPSYHCWARFHAEGVGWIPIDASEADKHPELREYNFGSQSADLVKFTRGRDVDLVPKQAGPALNKFIHPYVEVDGVVHEGVRYTVRYKRLPL